MLHSFDIFLSFFFLVECLPQTTQTAHTLYLDKLSRPIVSRHAMLRFHVMFFDWHLTAICCIQRLGLKIKKNTPILNIKHNVYEYCLFLKILHFLFKGFWILNYRFSRFLSISNVLQDILLSNVLQDILLRSSTFRIQSL